MANILEANELSSEQIQWIIECAQFSVLFDDYKKENPEYSYPLDLSKVVTLDRISRYNDVYEGISTAQLSKVLIELKSNERCWTCGESIIDCECSEID